jgi:mannose/cellobiose epimerase-like protein (N-acyl-D-glucosamine 2-epimerase family)
MSENAKPLVDWLIEDCLPFWVGQGFNKSLGLFYEAIDETGEPDLAAHLRVRVQFRQIYSFSHASVLGWSCGGAEIAHFAWGRVVKTAAGGRPIDGFAHTLNPDASISDSRRDAYDHAFAVLAGSWLYRATGDENVRRDVQAILDFVDANMTDVGGALREGLPPSLPRRQNPQMHWFEAMLALHEAIGHPEALRRASRFRDLLITKLVDQSTGTLGEYFDDAWLPAAGARGNVVEPGHMAEWTWLLRRHEDLAGLGRDPMASRLLNAALRLRDPETGLLIDESDRLGRVVLGTRRSWLATELAKAWTVEAEAGRPGAAAEAQAALKILDERHLRRPFTAGWIDRLDERAKPLAGPVPASILYHVFVAVAEAHRVFSKITS